MSTDAKTCPVEAQLPCLAHLRAEYCAPSLAPGAPYLAALPALITGALLFLVASGLVLAVHYDPAHGFASLQYIAHNVNNGWLVRGFHATGTTLVFGAVFLLLFRSLYTRAYRAPGQLAWLISVKLFAFLLLTAYLGYVLTDGAVSYWSLTDAANAAQSLTGIPGLLGTWFFGGPAGPGTLARLLVFHAILALGAVALVFALRSAAKVLAPKATGADAVSFHPAYTAQYFAAFAVFALIFALLVFFAPHFGQNPLNASAANPLIIPAALTPPWYLRPVSAIASVFPGAYGGIFGVIAALAVLAATPWLDRSGPHGRPGTLYRILTVLLALDVLGLGLAYSCPSALSSILVTVTTVWYFLHFLVLTPLVTSLEAE